MEIYIYIYLHAFGLTYKINVGETRGGKERERTGGTREGGTKRDYCGARKKGKKDIP
jgi:hypothetical protein